jgi:hypothetical protein
VQARVGVESDRLGSSESQNDLESDPPPPEIVGLRLRPALPSSRELLLVLALVFVSSGVQAFVVATRRIPTNSDQAIVGLMAKHIADGNGHPVFYYGSSYAGSLEAHFVAGLFSIFGPSPAVYRVAMVVLVDLTMLRYNIGFGLRFASPIGPAVLDFGFNISPDSRLGESTFAPHFSIGVF